jgi:uncharacterized 2Fe-2S/4Fe-4S cluster protein (DUF4445 family)
MTKEVRVTFQPSGRSVFVLPGTVLLEAAARAGHIVETPCGGAGKCGKCLVRVTSGDCPPTPHEEQALGAAKIREGYRLACQCRVPKTLVVEIPESSLFQSGQKILADHADEALRVCPAVSKRFVTLSPPSRDDASSDDERLRKALGDVDMDLSVMRALPQALRDGSFAVTATLIDQRVVNVEAGDHAGRCFGVAFDIGTTTLVGTLVNLITGADLAVASMINPQTSFGDDVVSRIKRCREDADGLAQLQKAILKAVNSLIAQVAQKAGIDRRSVCDAVFAGNTTMQEILCGINPMSLGEIPFVPAFRRSLRLRAGDMGLDINPAAAVTVFPQIGGFVGGDTVAGIVATRLDRGTAPTLLVDVGTNGEIVLAYDGSLVATSVAAGPAFEGARIVNGMRAANGAIEKVVMDGDVQLNVIGNVKPAGICGTGLIDATAWLLRVGVLDTTGRVLPPDELPPGVPEAIRRRIVEDRGQFDFVLVDKARTATGEDIRLYQRDVRELQLANGAIRAGINILLQTEGLKASDLSAVLLAGAFGNFIRRNNARRIGMLPPLETSRIRFVGNTASFGAKRLLLCTEEREYAERVTLKTRHLDLSLSPEFQMEFSSAMIFPEARECGEEPGKAGA